MFYYISYRGGYLRAGMLTTTMAINNALLIPESEIEGFKSGFAVWEINEHLLFIKQEDAEFYSVESEPERCLPNPMDFTSTWFNSSYRKTAEEALKVYQERRIKDAKNNFLEAKATMRELGLSVYEIKHNTKLKA